jgi:hypothetical protein
MRSSDIPSQWSHHAQRSLKEMGAANAADRRIRDAVLIAQKITLL